MTRIRFFIILSSLIGLTFTPLWGLGQKESAPVIQMTDQPRQFIAPGHTDAQSKILTLPFSTLTFSAKGQAIKSWTFSVFDSRGILVSQDSKEETRDRGFFGELFNIGDRPQVEIPKELTWSGTYNAPGNKNNGKLVPDGNYTYQISIADTAGGRAQTPPFNVTVKNANVSIDFIHTQNNIFSPTGQRPALNIEQSGSREKHWEGIFTDKTGKKVRSFIWENPTDNQPADVAPPNFAWDGKDQQGNILPDGEYRYTLLGQNRAGVSVQQQYAVPIMISMKKGLLNLASDVSVFSPLAEGMPNALTFIPEAGDTTGLQKWTLTVSAASKPKTALWSRTGALILPEKVAFDGKNILGQILPEGKYRAILSATFDNGNTEESQPLAFDLELTPPQAELNANATVFGGTSRPGVIVTLKGTPGIDWNLEIIDAKGTQLAKTSSDETGGARLDFEGTDTDGKALPDGTYTARASAHNKAGIPGSRSIILQKDTRPMNVAIDLSSPVLIPGTGTRNQVRITPVLDVVDSIVRTKIEIRDQDGKSVADRTNAGIFTFWDWNGTAADNKPLNDGKYQVSLEVTYTNGTIAVTGKELTLDSTYLMDKSPQVEMSLSSKTFVPGNIDGPSTLTVSIKTTEGVVPVEGWHLAVMDPRGKAFRQFDGKGIPPAEIIWDGKSDTGSLVESGEDYQILLKVTDTQKRETRKQDMVTIDILLQKLAEGKYKIVISSIQFAGYSSDIFKVGQPLLDKNLFVLRRLSAILNKFPDYKIRLEGYAVSEYWDNPKAAKEEQLTQLIPLSQDRAEEVKTALVLLGVDGPRFSVQGFGSNTPLVANSDLENRWKNRRVEFYLDKM